MKVCTKCKESKELDEFYKSKHHKHGVGSSCKECTKHEARENHHKNKERNNKNSSDYYKKNKEEQLKERKKYQQKNKEKIAKRSREHHEENKESINEKKRERYQENKESINTKRRKVYQTVELCSSVNLCYRCEDIKPLDSFLKDRNLCKSCSSKKARENYTENHEEIRIVKNNYTSKNRVKIRGWHNSYREENKDYLNKTGRERQKKRRSLEPLYNFKLKLRDSISKSLKRGGYTKRSKTFDILGVDYETFQTYISRKFKEGMTFENHGEWHLDHIIPMASANTEEEAIKLNHYTNFQPLWATDNLKKSDNIIEGTQVTIKI